MASDTGALRAFARGNALALNLLLPPFWPRPRTAAGARNRLCAWLQGVCRGLEAPDLARAADAAMAGVDPATVPEMNAWLRGRWQGEPAALEQLLRRLGFSLATVATVLWLHRLGAGQSSALPLFGGRRRTRRRMPARLRCRRRVGGGGRRLGRRPAPPEPD